MTKTTKMLPCTACSPARPDLGYHKAGRSRHCRDIVEVNGDLTWAWCCENCGNVKKPRKRAATPTYDEITRTLATADKLSRPDTILFHCFNPNGLYAELKASQDRIGAWVDANPDQPNGVLLVYGSLNDFHRKALFALLDKRRRVTRTEFAVTVSGIRREISTAAEWLKKKEDDK
ncbi:hypothetical protein [Mesorhizobium sp. Cs1299R1N3]|uniref:hypothetical protein n=1 Tax=Mesorhizobium sp. Cs1299R1N3 TaxID=3015173 RepID=UPI00301C77D9